MTPNEERLMDDERGVLDQEAYELDQLLSERLGPRALSDEVEDLPWEGRDVESFESTVARLFGRLQSPSANSSRSRRKSAPRPSPAQAAHQAE